MELERNKADAEFAPVKTLSDPKSGLLKGLTGSDFEPVKALFERAFLQGTELFTGYYHNLEIE